MTKTWPVLLLAIACSGKDTGDTAMDEHEDPGDHACEQVGTAGDAVSATTDIASAPHLEASETPYTVTLPDDGSGVYQGFVALQIDEDAEVLLFADTADVVTALYQDEAPATLPEASPAEECGSDLPEHWELDLAAGVWQLELGPSAVDTVWLMVLGAEGHGGHEDH